MGHRTLLCAVIITVVAAPAAFGFTPADAGAKGPRVIAAAPDAQTCPECGYENKPGANFCVKCGAELGREISTEKAVAEKECPECGYENKADVNFCIKCGARLQEEAPGGKTYCPQCGAENPEEAKFCTACGYALEGEKPGLGASSAPPAHRIGIYFTGGLAVYGELELANGSYVYDADLGPAWHVGGGFAIPIWRWAGTTGASIELTTDTGYSMIHREAYDVEADFKMIPTRESVILSVYIGPETVIKPFAGLGAGANVMLWKASYVATEFEIGSGSEVKPVFGIPFGCEFKLTPNFRFGARADYLIITGTFNVYDPREEETYSVTVPNLFLFGAVARVDF